MYVHLWWRAATGTCLHRTSIHTEMYEGPYRSYCLFASLDVITHHLCAIDKCRYTNNVALFTPEYLHAHFRMLQRGGGGQYIHWVQACPLDQGARGSAQINPYALPGSVQRDIPCCPLDSAVAGPERFCKGCRFTKILLTKSGRKKVCALGGGSFDPLFQTPSPSFRAHVMGTQDGPTGEVGGRC